MTGRDRRSQLRSQAGHDLLGGLAAVTELAALRFAVASVSCGSRHRLTRRRIRARRLLGWFISLAAAARLICSAVAC